MNENHTLKKLYILLHRADKWMLGKEIDYLSMPFGILSYMQSLI